jgi:4-diphosphocytidyl-2-C-methyl-D-erythritol kinase
MIRFSNCKINIGLQVINRRSDGFHDIQTLFYPVKFLSDAVEIIVTNCDTDQYFLTGIKIDEPIEGNLCYKAIQLLRKHYQFPFVDLHLHKMVPMGAGLGGGSADATTTLLLVNDFFNLEIEADKLWSFASQLGSDCAYFLHTKPQLGEGRGNELKMIDLDLSDKKLLIVKPDIHISTAQAYQNIIPNPNRNSLATLTAQPIEQWKEFVVNDFENSIFNAYPAIAHLKQQLYDAGALYAQMSGSGAACYGIFEQKPENINFPKGWLTFEGNL